MNARLGCRLLLIVLMFVLAASWSWKRYSRHATGFNVGLVAVPSQFGCGGNVVLTVSKYHAVKIDYSYHLPLESLADQLKGMCKERYTHDIFLRADPDVSFKELMEAVDITRGAVTDMQVVLLTPTSEKTTPCIWFDADPAINKID
jgi:hypothetical protein